MTFAVDHVQWIHLNPLRRHSFEPTPTILFKAIALGTESIRSTLTPQPNRWEHPYSIAADPAKSIFPCGHDPLEPFSLLVSLSCRRVNRHLNSIIDSSE